MGRGQREISSFGTLVGVLELMKTKSLDSMADTKWSPLVEDGADSTQEIMPRDVRWRHQE